MDTTEQLGWSNDVSFSRGKRSASGTVNTVKTDFQVKLELPRIINGDGKLHGK